MFMIIPIGWCSSQPLVTETALTALPPWSTAVPSYKSLSDIYIFVLCD